MASLGGMEMLNWDNKQITDQRRVNHSSSRVMGEILSRHEGVDISSRRLRGFGISYNSMNQPSITYPFSKCLKNQLADS